MSKDILDMNFGTSILLPEPPPVPPPPVLLHALQQLSFIHTENSGFVQAPSRAHKSQFPSLFVHPPVPIKFVPPQ